MSKKYHPDINPDEAAHEKFIEVSKGEHLSQCFRNGRKAHVDVEQHTRCCPMMRSALALHFSQPLTHSHSISVDLLMDYSSEKSMIDMAKRVCGSTKRKSKEGVITLTTFSRDSLEVDRPSRSRRVLGC